MKETKTSGGQRNFNYNGSLKRGYDLLFETGTVHIPAKLIFAILEKYIGKSVFGGFNMTDPEPDGLGEFIQQYSESNLERVIVPRYATHIAAILKDEEMLTISKREGKVFLDFSV